MADCDSNKITLMLALSTFSAVLGMFQFGFNTGVINAPQKILEEFIAQIYSERHPEAPVITEKLKSLIWSITVGIFAIGGMFGGYFGPKVADLLGRRNSLILNNITAILGVTLMSISKPLKSYEIIMIGRLIIGLNCGANTALVPMYLSEISVLKYRGAVGIISQLAATIGILISQILGYNGLLGSAELWPYLFGVAYVPAILQIFILLSCPESPRYLLLNLNNELGARLSLKKLRGSDDVDEDINEMKAEAQSQEEEIRKYGKITSVSELFKYSWLRKPILIAIVMQLSQQLSGINAVLNYSTDIFLSAGISNQYATFATMGVGLVLVVMTLVSIPLIDRLGRRTLHLTGLGGMFWMSIVLTFALLSKSSFEWVKYASIVIVLIYIMAFSIGPGSLPWMITSELFTQGARPAAVSVATLVNWLANFLVGSTFLLMKNVLQDYSFLPFTLIMAIIWFYIYKNLPETKGRTFEEIASVFKRPPNSSSQPTGGHNCYNSCGDESELAVTEFVKRNATNNGSHASKEQNRDAQDNKTSPLVIKQTPLQHNDEIKTNSNQLAEGIHYRGLHNSDKSCCNNYGAINKTCRENNSVDQRFCNNVLLINNI